MNEVNRTLPPSVRELSGMKLPNVTEKLLPNGIRLVMLDSGSQPVSRLTLSWEGGTYDMPSPAVAKVMASTINEGTRSRSGAEIAEVLEYNGAWTRYDVDPHTFTATLYGLNSRAAEVLPVFVDVVSSPLFIEEVIDTQRQKLAAQCETNRKKIAVKVNEIWRPMCYGGNHPGAALLTGMDYLGVTRDDVLRLYERSLATVIPTAYLAGKITPELQKLVESVLGGIEFKSVDTPLKVNIVPVSYPQGGDFRTLLVEDSLQSAVKIGVPAVPRNHPDFAKLRLATVALGGYFGSRLMTNIREDKGYTYGINAVLAAGRGEGTFLTVSCQTDNRYVDAVIDETFAEIGRLASEPMPEEELKGVRRLVLSSMAAVLDSPFTVMDYIYTMRTLGLPENYYAYQLNTAEELTADDVSHMIAKHIVPNMKLIAVAGNYTRKDV